VEQGGHSIVYAGIDEAGYGPILGPLCVGMAVFEVPAREPGAPAPDLWKLLSPAVCRTPAQTRRGAIAVADSKKLKLPNSSRTRHPLMHLERGVLAFAAQRAGLPETDADLMSSLGVRLERLEWYAGERLPLPLSTTADLVRISAAKLGGACDTSGVRVLDLCARTVDEATFNERLADGAGKAAVSFSAVAGLMARVWRSEACRTCADAESAPRVVVDRQGGRIEYAGVLARALPDARVTILEESPRASRYELVSASGEDGPVRRMRVQFQMEAEQRHLPVALASMIAKLVRELAMERFNRYWCARVAELKPTAGYYTDGKRWLRDVRRHLSPDTLELLERRA